jgi:metallo-beta-lactamase family protein
MTKLFCYGGVGTVTGANFLLEVNAHKYIIDCGLLQGVKGAEEINLEEFPYEPSEIKALFVTHAHMDHIGRIPKLVKAGFRGEIYSTPETRDIAELMLADACRIMERALREDGSKPLYGQADLELSLKLWKTISYDQKQDFGDFRVRLLDAGHILGSAMWELSFPSGKKILFSGDIGNSPSPLIKPTERVEGLSYLVMDSVYGDRNHEDRATRSEKLKRILIEGIERGGAILIPVFSLERTQVILYELNNLIESKEIPSVPVFLDSPLAIRVTEIYDRISKHYNLDVQNQIKDGDNIFDFPRLKETAAVRDSREIAHVPGPKIILAGSGMSTAGRIVAHEEMYLPDPKTTLLFLGYQAPGTLGRQIEEGLKKVVINDHQIQVRAKIEKIDGYSAHADSDALVNFVSSSAETLKKVFVAMGEPRSSIFLAQRLHDEYALEAIVPEQGKAYELEL